jgi:hypothetical protein
MSAACGDYDTFDQFPANTDGHRPRGADTLSAASRLISTLSSLYTLDQRKTVVEPQTRILFSLRA